jgi:hypothetical protein
MSLVLQSSGGGQITINEPATASNFTQTLPAATGTVMVSGNMPAFSAYASGTTTISSGYSDTLISINTEEFDNGNGYNNTGSTATLNGLSVPAYSFCPNVAGYYQVNGSFTLTQVKSCLILIYKNGNSFKQGVSAINSAVNNEYNTSTNVTSLIYLNGTGDYIQLRANTPTASTVGSGVAQTYFQAVMVRAA